MGELQGSYATFCNSVLNFHHLLLRDYHSQKIAVTRERLASRREVERVEHRQHALREEQEAVYGDIFYRDSMLYAQGMMSAEDYGKARLTITQSRLGPIEREVEEGQHHMQEIADKETLLDLDNQQFQTHTTFKNYQQ